MIRVLVDSGNTRLKAMVLRGGQRAAVVSFSGAARLQEFSAWLRQQGDVQELVIADVWKMMQPEEWRRLAQVDCVFVEPASEVLEVRYEPPSRYGVDRWLALLAAVRRYPQQNVMVINVGTAITIDMWNVGEGYAGGVLMLSPEAYMEAFHARFPHLESGPWQGDMTMMSGFSTARGVEAGMTWLYGLGLRAAVERVSKAQSDCKVVLGGGGSNQLLPFLGAVEWHIEYLVLEGMVEWIEGRKH